MYNMSYCLRNSLCSASSLAYLLARVCSGDIWSPVDLRAVCLVRYLGGRARVGAYPDGPGGSFGAIGAIGVTIGGGSAGNGGLIFGRDSEGCGGLISCRDSEGCGGLISCFVMYHAIVLIFIYGNKQVMTILKVKGRIQNVK